MPKQKRPPQAGWEIYGASDTNAPKGRQYRTRDETPGCRDFILGLLTVLALLITLIWIIRPLPVSENNNDSWDSQNTNELPSPQQTGALTISARIVNGESSSQSYYLDGSYTPRITVIDSEENCVLSLFARAPGDSYGTPIFNDLVFGNAGTFPGPYRQTFTWDSVSFSQESYVRIYNDGGCDEVLLYMSRE